MQRVHVRALVCDARRGRQATHLLTGEAPAAGDLRAQRAVQHELRERGLVEGEGPRARLTPAGTAMADQLLSARREELRALLAGQDDAERTPEVQVLLERLCVELSGQRPDRAGDGRPAQPRGAQASIS